MYPVGCTRPGLRWFALDQDLTRSRAGYPNQKTTTAQKTKKLKTPTSVAMLSSGNSSPFPMTPGTPGTGAGDLFT